MDNDGIPIPQDKCPTEPETVNDYQDDDGCPDKKPLVELKETEVQINEKIMFDKNSADIRPESMPIIDAVADLLKKNPEVQLTEVGGHASREGDEGHNRRLSQKRVDAIVKALVERGVEKDRLLSQGYGFYCPLDPGEGEVAYEKNRRVEFKILYRKGKDLGQQRGCEEAEKKGVKPKPLPELKPFDPNAPAPAAAPPASGGAAKPPTMKPGPAPAPGAPAPAPAAPAPAPGGAK
jgi:outer membrane protein OmpA-like peptidoglycan-associated protein